MTKSIRGIITWESISKWQAVIITLVVEFHGIVNRLFGSLSLSAESRAPYCNKNSFYSIDEVMSYNSLTMVGLNKMLNFFSRFFFESERGIFPNTEFVFDLELPVDFIPTNNDGEVAEFELVPVAQVRLHANLGKLRSLRCP